MLRSVDQYPAEITKQEIDQFLSKGRPLTLACTVHKVQRLTLQNIVFSFDLFKQKLKASEPPNRSKVFAKLVLEGQINSAPRFLSETTSGSVLSSTD